MKKKIFGAIALLLVVFGAWWYYNSKMSATKIAVVAFPDFMLEKMVTSNNNSFIEIENLPLSEIEKIEEYPFVLLRGHGIRITPEQLQVIREAGEKGVKIYIGSVTNPEYDLTNLAGKELDFVTDLMENKCTQNYESLFNYIRKEVDGKQYFLKPYAEKPYILPGNFFFHIENDLFFENVSDYENYYKKKGFYKENAPKVVVLSGNINSQNSNPEHTNKLIEGLEKQGINVYPIQAFGGNKTLDLLKECKPDLVIVRPHGRVALGQNRETLQWLIEANVPLLAPVTVYQNYEKWLKSKRGMSGGLLSMSVVIPELDGATVPYALIAEMKNSEGFEIFDEIPGRMKDFTELVANWLKLQTKPNAEKKIAIYYFKGPGKNALVAQGLEVLPALYNTVKRLKKEGYNVGNFPNSKEEFYKIMMSEGAVLGPYALGAFDHYLKNGHPALVEVLEYENWCKEAMPKALYDAVVEKYGKAPGKYMAVEKDGKSYVAVTRVQFGNVCLLPHPLPGLGEDTGALVHGAKVAPPHPYLASYLWTRYGFKADAISHFGTHGSLEFTPGKQVVLSSNDWSDRLIGNMPHFYIYTINNIGEGIIAKRRSYATLLTHLTPPFMKSELREELAVLNEKLNRYRVASSRGLKKQYAKAIKVEAEALNIHNVMRIDSAKNYEYTPADMEKVHSYLEQIAEEKVGSGLYTVGTPYTEAKLSETAGLMALDPIAFSLAKLDAQKGKISEKKADNLVYVSDNYRPVAERIIKEIVRGGNEDKILGRYVSKTTLDFAHQWKKDHASFDLLAMMMTKVSPSKDDKLTVKKELLPTLLVNLCEDEKNKKYILSLQSEKTFKRSSKLLDASQRAKVSKLAERMKSIAPEMYEAVQIAKQEDMLKLLSLMQDSTLYAETFKLLEDTDLAKKIASQKVAFLKEKAVQCESAKNLAVLNAIFTENLVKFLKNKSSKELNEVGKSLDFYKKNTKAFSYCSLKGKQLQKWFADTKNWNEKLAKAKEILAKELKIVQNKESVFAQAILSLETNIKSVKKYRNNLKISTEKELVAIANAYKGGYTAPQSGGDAISNPQAIPTGRNMYSIDAERTPSEESWKVGKKLAKSLLEQELKAKGHYPKKVSFTLWGTSFISTEGATIAQIFYMLGVEPVRDGFGTVRSLKLIPIEQLGRPRIDVVVQTSGQARDLAGSRLELINRAVAMAGGADDADSLNYVSKGLKDAEKFMLKKGFSPVDARKYAGQRVFGGVNGNYGAAIMGMVESGDRWESDDEIAKNYINNMGAIYGGDKDWGDFKAGIFEAALLNAETVVQPRASNTTGPLNLDHMYEFMGGINLAIRKVTGNDANSYFNDFRNSSNPRMQELKEAIGVEANATVFNPKYIKEMLKGEATSMETFAETFRNTYGWNVMKPSAIDKQIWDTYFDVYIKDQYKLGIRKTFEEKNPYALQEMTAVMLETARKGYWKATPEQLKEMAKLHTELVKDHTAGCSGFVCDNAKLRNFIAEKVTPELAKAYEKEIKEVREVKVEEKKNNVVLKKEEQNKEKQAKKTTEITEKSHAIWWIGGLFVLLVLGLFAWKRRR
ncbi:MAG: cobaltochelatase subunit CobN [Flavobacteriaceae bacterium]|nr:cobaltochelatase subunit CobN [Flavobacteriaceae bacterium]